MTSHNDYCHCHLLQKRGPFCPITAVLLAVLSFVLGILNVLDVLFMSESSKLSCLVCFYLFSFLSYPPTLSHRVKRKFYKCSHRPTGTAPAYFEVRALVTMLLWTHSLVKLMIIIYQNDEKEISSQNLIALPLVWHFLLPFPSPFSGMLENHLHISHVCSMTNCCVETAGG
jgi:hypothetical protein